MKIEYYVIVPRVQLDYQPDITFQPIPIIYYDNIHTTYLYSNLIFYFHIKYNNLISLRQKSSYQK